MTKHELAKRVATDVGITAGEAGSTDDPWLRGFGAGVAQLAERARGLTLEA